MPIFIRKPKFTGTKCPICNAEMTSNRGPRQAVKDHCHLTGQKRRTICHRCNVGLGMFGDSISALVSAVIYLQVVGGKVLDDSEVKRNPTSLSFIPEKSERSAQEEAFAKASRLLKIRKTDFVRAIKRIA